MKNLAILALGIAATVYLLNPTAGILELIPDNFPVVGNLDEASATAILLSSLAYFGIDLTHLFKKDSKKTNVRELPRD